MLEVEDIHLAYGRHHALGGVSIAAAPGETVAILGANGAGKTSLLHVITGWVRPQSGTVRFEGRDITHFPRHEIVEAGIALVPEGRRLFGSLTVAENLALGAYPRRARGGEAVMLRRVYKLFPRLSERRRQAVSTLSGGEQQMVAIGRALMSSPALLLLDEPSLGLAPLLVEELFRVLREVAVEGLGILIVEQNARHALALAGRAYLLAGGRIVGHGPVAVMAQDQSVRSSYLGGASAEEQV
jgi:branched-chain amino acid transport system ATP-binding protein